MLVSFSALNPYFQGIPRPQAPRFIFSTDIDRTLHGATPELFEKSAKAINHLAGNGLIMLNTGRSEEELVQPSDHGEASLAQQLGDTNLIVDYLAVECGQRVYSNPRRKKFNAWAQALANDEERSTQLARWAKQIKGAWELPVVLGALRAAVHKPLDDPNPMFTYETPKTISVNGKLYDHIAGFWVDIVEPGKVLEPLKPEVLSNLAKPYEKATQSIIRAMKDELAKRDKTENDYTVVKALKSEYRENEGWNYWIAVYFEPKLVNKGTALDHVVKRHLKPKSLKAIITAGDSATIDMSMLRPKRYRGIQNYPILSGDDPSLCQIMEKRPRHLQVDLCNLEKAIHQWGPIQTFPNQLPPALQPIVPVFGSRLNCVA